MNLLTLQKSRTERRKEHQHWVNLLLMNLRKIYAEIEQLNEDVEMLFKKESQARRKFEQQKKRGVAQEKQLREEIQQMKKRLLDLVENNQTVNFKNYERVQEIIDDQERKYNEKQLVLRKHASCLE